MDPVEPGLACGSDTAHMNIFGFDPRVYYRGRGAMESLGAGLDMIPGDIAFKSNFGTLSQDNIVVTRRADRDFEQDGAVLCQALDGLKVPGYEEYQISVRYATEHRLGVRIRGPFLSDQITGTDPLRDNLPLLTCQPVTNNSNDNSNVRISCDLVNKLSGEMTRLLSTHSINRQRILDGKNPANVVLFRGAGSILEIPTFNQKWSFLFQNDSIPLAIAPTCMIAGWMAMLGVECVRVHGATGDYHTDIYAKTRAALSLLFPHDNNSTCYWTTSDTLITNPCSFLFLHIKAVDDAGHDGRLDLKIRFLEEIDKALGELVENALSIKGGDELTIIVTGDHSTPITLCDHSCEPVPFLICRLSELNKKKKKKSDDCVERFAETEAVKGRLGRFPGSQCFPILQAFQSYHNE